MHSLNTQHRVRAAACAVTLALALPASGVLAAHHPTTHTSAPKWLVANAKTKTAVLTLIAAYNNNVSGFNFNGYGKGKMVVSVPVNYHVNVVFSNKSALPHNALVVPYSERSSTGNFTLAFKGAATGKATEGVAKGPTKKFAFVASKPGTYAIVCGIPGHAVAGMWDVLKVTSGGSASIAFK